MSQITSNGAGARRNGGGESNGIVTLPQRFPASMLLTAIRDVDVLALLAEEEALRKQRNDIREELRVVQDEKDRLIRELRPATDKLNNDLATTMAELHARKDELYRVLEDLRANQDTIAHARDEFRSLGFILPGLNRDISDTEMLLRDEKRELERLEKSSDPHRIDVQRKRVDKFAAMLQVKGAERKKVEEERQALRDEVDRLSGGVAPEERNKRYQEIRKDIAAVQEQLNGVKRQRAGQRPQNPVLGELREKQNTLYDEIARCEARLDAIRRDALPHQHFSYPADRKMAIVGRVGATLRQLQIDFGVAICVDMVEAGHGFVLGGAEDVAGCVEAIQCLLAGLTEDAVETDTVNFPPAMKRQIIGARGATIENFERESGARLNVQDDCVEITGAAEAVDAAKAALTEFIDSLSTAEMTFDPSNTRLIIGKAGATITQIEKDSGVRSLRVDRARNRVVATGRQAAIAKAFAMYREILGETAGGSATVQADEAFVRSVIGPKGRTVRELEESTGTRITCDVEHNHIHITGPRDAVKAAKEKVEELRRTETRVPADSRALNFLTAPIVRLAAHEEDAGGHRGKAGGGESVISPLEAVQRATGCDQVVPVRSEGVVVVRGRPELAQRAALMVKQLILQNQPHTLRVPFADVLRGFLLRRQTSERGSSLLDQVCKHYSPLLRIDMDRDAHMLLVSSYDPEEAREAAAEMSGLLKDIMSRQVRVMEDFPASKLGLLIGPSGSTIRELQEVTGTDIAVLRNQRVVQIFSAEGDAKALQRAVAEIRRDILQEAPEEEGEEEEEKEEEALG